MGRVLKFPKNFLWGCSTSAYQVEGGIEKSDWSKFADAGIACDHYHRYEEDFDLLKQLYQNAYRFSIEWSRIEPQEGKFNQEEIRHYQKVVLALKKRNILPFVVLYHFSLPLWFQKRGGWLDPDSEKYFKRYCQKVLEALGSEVNYWITINEPMVYVANSYLKAKWPPLKKNIFEAKKALRNLIKAHKVAYELIHASNREAKIGISKNVACFSPYANKLINRILVFLADYSWNNYFLTRIKGYQDFVGVNYYFYNRIKFCFRSLFAFRNFPENFYCNTKSGKFSDIGWRIEPEGIYCAIKNVSYFKKPIYITENGLADKEDKLRKEFIKQHLFWVHKAIEDGMDVLGYFYWSLMDNFEWEKGFEPRFGLFEINYKTLERKIRPSAFYYAKICKNNALIID
ncbi:glycoside hydrolase family 1 protein [bacterium]|nr:glycoside hydrolase family 1 protein [bacterium]